MWKENALRSHNDDTDVIVMLFIKPCWRSSATFFLMSSHNDETDAIVMFFIAMNQCKSARKPSHNAPKHFILTPLVHIVSHVDTYSSIQFHKYVA